MIQCLIEILLSSPLVLKELSEQKDCASIGRNLLLLFKNRKEPALSAYLMKKINRELQKSVDLNSPIITLWQSLLQKCGVENINQLSYTKMTKCDRCTLRNTFQMDYHHIKVNLFDKTDEVNLARLLFEYEDSGVPDTLQQQLIKISNCEHVLHNDIFWKSFGSSMHFSFERFDPTKGVFARAKVNLPLVVSFASKAFELYAVIRMHNDEVGDIKYDAVVFDVSKAIGGTKQAVRIDEHGVRTAYDEFNDLRKITSTNVVLALYDDIIGKFELFPKPMPEIKTEVQSFDTLSHINQLHPNHDEVTMVNKWAERLVVKKQKEFVIHDVLPRIIDCKSYLPHHIPNYVGKHGFVLIIRHFVDDKNIHDHIIHDCVWSAGDCRCELITKKIQPNSVHRRVISWDQLFSLMHTLKLENVICAYSNNEFYINRFMKMPQPNIVDADLSHPLIDWADICGVNIKKE